MGFIERVPREALHLVEKRLRDASVHAPAQAALGNNISILIDLAVDEYLALVLHYISFFLAHCTADGVSPAETVTREGAENLHDLLLIDDAAVGHAENIPEQRVLVFDL